MLDSIPEDSIAVTVYLLGSLLILWCWYSIATRLPKLLGGIPQGERLIKLNQIAIQQMKILEGDGKRKLLK
jgi:hypothetical protein